MSRTLAALVATIGVAAGGVALAPSLALTPGGLAAGHQAVRDDCFACHAAFQGAPAAKCLVCHQLEGLGLRTVEGQPRAKPDVRNNRLHAVVRGDCGGCHAEHRGRGATRARFSHQQLEPAAREGCAACHAQERPSDALHRSATGECSACHQLQAWKPATFEHARYFVFDENHPARCQDCHAGQAYDRYTCYGCHDHTPENMAAAHREEGLTDLADCVKCHRSGSEHGEGGGGRERDGERDDD
jgi:hypothetical protein